MLMIMLLEVMSSVDIEFCTFGPKFGYYARSKKTHLIVKTRSLRCSEMNFALTDIKIVTEMVEHLGGAISSEHLSKIHVPFPNNIRYGQKKLLT